MNTKLSEPHLTLGDKIIAIIILPFAYCLSSFLVHLANFWVGFPETQWWIIGFTILGWLGCIGEIIEENQKKEQMANIEKHMKSLAERDVK